MTPQLSFTACALALMSLGVGAPSSAEGNPPDDWRSSLVLVQAGMSLDQAVKMAEQHFRARVVRAESQQEGGRTVYVLRLLNDSGRVWTVRVDAASGALL